MSKLITFFYFIFISSSFPFFFLVALLIWAATVMFDRRLRLLHLYTSLWASFYLMIIPFWKVNAVGRNKIDKNKTYVVISNHQSLLDIVVSFTLYFHFKWVSKIEIFKIPFMGWNMSLNQYIKLKRGDKESINKMLDDVEERLSDGSSVFMFPEGTRSETGVLKQFKPGAFLMAKKMKVPLLLIAINGTRNALPKKSVVFNRKQNLTIEVIEEVPYEVFKDMEIDEIAEITKRKIGAYVVENIRGAVDGGGDRA